MLRIFRHKTLLCFALLALTACQSTEPPAYLALKLFPQGKVFSGYQLIDQDNQNWGPEQFKGQYSVVFFGFTNCPDICPTTLLDMQKIDKKLQSKGQDSPQFVFVSVDPDRDSPDQMKQYINHFNPAFKGLVGDAANILSLTTQLGVAYQVEEHEPGAQIYDVDHSSAWFLISPEGERIGLFQAPHDIESITQDLTLLMSQS